MAKSQSKKTVQVDRATARREFLALRPGRNPKVDWEEVEGKAVLKVPRPTDWKFKLAKKLLPIPEIDKPKIVALDAIGSHVWVRCDGKNTIGYLSKELQSAYKLSAREAELSLQQFFKELGRRGYVGFMMENEASNSKK
ncbi:PqqD family protein [bacterium]|nr:MAG: PqqD family protein [bacterium]